MVDHRGATGPAKLDPDPDQREMPESQMVALSLSTSSNAANIANAADDSVFTSMGGDKSTDAPPVDQSLEEDRHL